MALTSLVLKYHRKLFGSLLFKAVRGSFHNFREKEGTPRYWSGPKLEYLAIDTCLCKIKTPL
jgi:hypothetical protein